MYPVPYKKNKMLLVRIYRNFLKTIRTIDHVDSCLNVMGKGVVSYPGFWIPKIDEKSNLRLTIHGQPSFTQKSFLSTQKNGVYNQLYGIREFYHETNTSPSLSRTVSIATIILQQ